MLKFSNANYCPLLANLPVVIGSGNLLNVSCTTYPEARSRSAKLEINCRLRSWRFSGIMVSVSCIWGSGHDKFKTVKLNYLKYRKTGCYIWTLMLVKLFKNIKVVQLYIKIYNPFGVRCQSYWQVKSFGVNDKIQTTRAWALKPLSHEGICSCNFLQFFHRNTDLKRCSIYRKLA